MTELEREYFITRQQLDSSYKYFTRKPLVAKCKAIAEIIGLNKAHILDLKSMQICKERCCYYTRYQR